MSERLNSKAPKRNKTRGIAFGIRYRFFREPAYILHWGIANSCVLQCHMGLRESARFSFHPSTSLKLESPLP